jgi:hypothetical protein
VIDFLLELHDSLEWLAFVGALVAGVLVGFYLLGRAVPIRFAIAIFGFGTGIIALLAYRGYQSTVDYCKGSYEVSVGGDKFSCLEPQHWFANMLAASFLLLAELGLTSMLAVGVLRWHRQRRLAASA